MLPVVERRISRHDAIRDIVRSKSVRTQRGLVDELHAMGFNCTQATVSRDVAEMRLRKLPEGVYILDEDLHLQRMFSEFVNSVDHANNLVVVKTQPGTAPAVAAAIDAAALAGVMGTVAGNDTILVIATTNEEAVGLVKMLCKLRESRA